MFGTLARMTDADYADRALLELLLDAHPGMVDFDAVMAKLSDVPDVAHALERLSEDGLARRLGDRVGATRAAVRFLQLDL